MNCLFEIAYENIDDSDRTFSFSKKRIFFDDDDAAKRRKRDAKKLQNDLKDPKITKSNVTGDNIYRNSRSDESRKKLESHEKIDNSTKSSTTTTVPTTPSPNITVFSKDLSKKRKIKKHRYDVDWVISLSKTVPNKNFPIHFC